MARIFITGSSDGLGQIIARHLIAQGHSVTLHARSAARAADARAGAPGASDVLVGDLSSIAQTKLLAAEANATSTDGSGGFDVVIHNAGIGYATPEVRTEDGLADVFAINSLAPYILTCLMRPPPRRLVYMSSGLHGGGDGGLRDLGWTSGRAWDGAQAYRDSKLQNVLLAFAVARRWAAAGVEANAVVPGWVRTKMGGPSAPGDAETGARDAIRLAGSRDSMGSGQYWSGGRATAPHRAASDTAKQDEYLRACEELSGVRFPDL